MSRLKSYLDDWGRGGEEPLVLGEVLYPKRGRHDEQLEGQAPLWTTVWCDSGTAHGILHRSVLWLHITSKCILQVALKGKETQPCGFPLGFYR